MEQIKIYNDLMDDFEEYFLNRPDLLPEGVVLKDVNIIGDAYLFPENGRIELSNWEVVFRGDLGKLERVGYYDLVFEGPRLIDVRKASN